MRNGGMLGVPNTDGRGSWSPAERGLGLYSGIAGSLATRNILNGVLNCAWDKTSAVPKLLEIYNTSFVKFNIDYASPLIMAFANGWDDLDRPAQVVKRLAVAPSNIDLSAKANCHVQVVAKVINDEVVITTHDIYDPAVGYGSNIIPNFSTGRGGTDAVATKDGWTVSSEGYSPENYPWKAVDRNGSTNWSAGGYQKLIVAPPFATSLALIKFSKNNTTTRTYILSGKFADADAWTQLASAAFNTTSLSVEISDIRLYRYFAITYTSSPTVYEFEFYERPTAKFYRGLNKVKDRSDVEQLWINLGYATVDAAGAITALTHYTDLRNNYPGGMRVEA